jgi:DTW domain-containing protein
MNLVHKNCHIFHRGHRDESIVYSDVLKEETHTPLFLFPDDKAVTLTKEYADTLEKPINLIVPDGSWRQAKKFKKRIPELAHIQSVTIPKGELSQYSLRTAPQENMLSTFEAMSRVLGILEGKKLEQSLNEILAIMVKQVEISRKGNVFDRETSL